MFWLTKLCCKILWKPLDNTICWGSFPFLLHVHSGWNFLVCHFFFFFCSACQPSLRNIKQKSFLHEWEPSSGGQRLQIALITDRGGGVIWTQPGQQPFTLLPWWLPSSFPTNPWKFPWTCRHSSTKSFNFQLTKRTGEEPSDYFCTMKMHPWHYLLNLFSGTAFTSTSSTIDPWFFLL